MNLIDLHCDTLWGFMKDDRRVLRESDLCVDLKKLERAGSLAQFFACFILIRAFQGDDRWEQGYQHALKLLSRGKQEFAANADRIAFAGNLDDLLRNRDAGRISGFFTLEEGGVLNGKMEHLEELYREGIRLVTLTWNEENCIGYPNSDDPEVMKRGLKPFGIDVVNRMNELGMIVDVSHLSDGGFWDVMKYSKKPAIASHSNARALCGHRRNLTDDMIRALAEQGGVSGLNFYPCFIDESHSITAEHLADHVEHMYQVGGEDFVAIGTDFDGYSEGTSTILHMGQMDEVYDAIKRRGFTSAQMDKIWSGNAMRVIRENMK